MTLGRGRVGLETPKGSFASLSEADPHEKEMIDNVIQDLREMGPYSYYLRRILGEFKGHGDS